MTPNRTASRRNTILLAEDDRDARRLFALALAADGDLVVELAMGSEVGEYVRNCVLEKRADRIPDLIVTDVRMPGMSGLQLLAAIRQGGWSIPVILVTGFADDQVRALAASLGAVAVLDKPFDPVDLRAAARRALGGASS